MSQLISELKKEHVVIAETLNKVKQIGITSAEGQNTLLAAKKGLVAHLKKEDDQLYAFLNKKAESDASLKRTLDAFVMDMEGITKAALEFFEKYSKGGSGLEFAKDFGRLYAVLSQRIYKEENVVYKKYDELKP